MNLGELISRIGDTLSHAPSNEARRTQLIAMLNREYSALYTSEPFRFRLRAYRFRVIPPIEFGFAGWLCDAPAFRTIRFAAPTGMEALYSVANQGWVANALNGAIVTPPSTVYDDLTLHGYGARGFVCERGLFAGSTQFDMTLDPRFFLDGGKTADHTGAWEVAFLRYPMPRDLAQVVQVVQVDEGTAPAPLAPFAMEGEPLGYQHDPATTGTPIGWTVDPPGSSAQYTDGTPLQPMSHEIVRVAQDIPRAPVRVMTLAQTTDGSFPTSAVGVRIQYCMTWEWAGMESAPGPVAEITLTTGNNKVNLSNLEVYEDSTFGRTKRIYRRFGEGRWQRVSTSLVANIGTTSDSGGNDPAYFDRDGRETLLNAQPTQKFIRFWPTPDDYHDMEVRYLNKPRRLEALVDEPEMPSDYHEILIHLVCAKEFAQQGATDAAKQQLVFAADIRRAMTRNELQQSTQPMVSGARRTQARGGVFATSTINWTPDT